MSAGPVLSARGLHLVRPGGFSLTIDHLSVARREVVALLGPNGAGKSTLLQALALLEPSRAGTILLDGEPVSGKTLAARRRMAVVLQEPLLLRGSVRDNVALGLRLHGISRPDRASRAAHWMDRTGIAHLAGRPARSLSGGEQRRVSLARALALQPLILFLDEPLAALDAPGRRTLLDDLRGWIDDAGCAVILVTHDRDEALHLADRVILLFNGAVRQSGPVDQVFAGPVDAEVAAFLGIENVLPGEILGAQGCDQSRIRIGDVDLVANGRHGPGAVQVALHPEQVLLTAPGETPRDDTLNRLPSRVLAVEHAGSQLRIRLDAGFPLTALVSRTIAPDLNLVPGAPLTASIKPTALHIIPSQSSTRPTPWVEHAAGHSTPD